MAKKRNVWEGRGTFKNSKWEWTKGSICLRSRVFHRPYRQLAAALLKTISIPSRDTHFLSPFFLLLSKLLLRSLLHEAKMKCRRDIGAKFLSLSPEEIFSSGKKFLKNIPHPSIIFDFFNDVISPGDLTRRNGLRTAEIIENGKFFFFSLTRISFNIRRIIVALLKSVTYECGPR